MRNKMLICLVLRESQQPHVQGDSMPRGDVGLAAPSAASVRILSAGSAGASSLLLMLQTPSHFSGLWPWL